MKTKFHLTIIVLLTVIVPIIYLYPLSPSVKGKKILKLKWGKTPGEVGLEMFQSTAMGPRSFYIDKNKNIYILDNSNYRIEIFNSEGKYGGEVNLKTISDYPVIRFSDLIVDDSQYIYLIGYYMESEICNSSLNLSVFKDGKLISKKYFNGGKFKATTGIENTNYYKNPISEYMMGGERLFIKGGRIWLDLGDYTYLLDKLIWDEGAPKKFTLIKKISTNTKYFKSRIDDNPDLKKVLDKKYNGEWMYVGKYKGNYLINTLDDSLSLIDTRGIVKKRVGMGLDMTYFTGNYLQLLPDGSLYVMENDSSGIKLFVVNLKDILNI